MKLKSILISNFGIFYGVNSIEINDSITMITGRSGSGKTTLVNAFKWALSRYSNEPIWTMICRTRFDELEIGQQDYMKVNLCYFTSEDYFFEKSMSFSKDETGKLITGDITTTLSSQSECLHGQDAVYRLLKDFPLLQFHAVSLGDVELTDIINLTIIELKSVFEPYLLFAEKSALRTIKK